MDVVVGGNADHGQFLSHRNVLYMFNEVKSLKIPEEPFLFLELVLKKFYLGFPIPLDNLAGVFFGQTCTLACNQWLS